MHHAQTAIVFHAFNYSETSLIIKLFTKESGLKTLIYKGAKRKKNQAVQPLSLVNVEYYQKEGHEMGTVRSMSLYEPFHSIYSDIYKTSVLMFVKELLYKTVREEEQNERLFYFIEQFLLKYDLEEFNPNAHLWFALHLMTFLGIQPDMDSYQEQALLHLEEGIYQPTTRKTERHTSKEIAAQFNLILGMNFADIPALQLTNLMRRDLLQAIIEYYETQLSDMKTINSHTILKELLL